MIKYYLIGPKFVEKFNLNVFEEFIMNVIFKVVSIRR